MAGDSIYSGASRQAGGPRGVLARPEAGHNGVHGQTGVAATMDLLSMARDRVVHKIPTGVTLVTGVTRVGSLAVTAAVRAPSVVRAAAVLVALEALALLVLAVLELLALTGERLVMGISTTIFFAGYGAALLVGAWGLVRPWDVARSPIVVAQLIQLGVAWSFRGGDTAPVAAVLAVVALAVLVLVLLPASTAFLVPEDEQ